MKHNHTESEGNREIPTDEQKRQEHTPIKANSMPK